MIMFIFDDEFVTCELDDSIPVLKHRWKKPMQGKVFRENLITIQKHYIELVKSYSNLAWLADTRLLGEVDEETEEWFSEIWDDLLFSKAKVKVHAVILSKNLFAEYPMEKFKMDAERKFKELHVQLGVFSDEASALNWIRTR